MRTITTSATAKGTPSQASAPKLSAHTVAAVATASGTSARHPAPARVAWARSAATTAISHAPVSSFTPPHMANPNRSADCAATNPTTARRHGEPISGAHSAWSTSASIAAESAR